MSLERENYEMAKDLYSRVFTALVSRDEYICEVSGFDAIYMAEVAGELTKRAMEEFMWHDDYISGLREEMINNE